MGRCAVIFRMLWSLLLLLFITTSISLAWAAPIPFPPQEVEIATRNQPIKDFLQEFFGQLGLRVVVSPNAAGAVSGSFKGPPEQVLHKLLQDFGLMAFYDGITVHIYLPAEAISRTFPMHAGGASSLIATALRMQLTNEFNSLHTSQNGGIIASGSRRFVEMVGELAASQQEKAMLLGPMGFKVYYLRYAWAHDVIAQSGNKTTVVPGIASILRTLLTSQSANGQTPVLTQYMGTGEQSLRSHGLSRREPSTLGAPGASPYLTSAGTVQRAWDNRTGDTHNAGMGAPLQDSVAPAAVDGARVEADMRLNAIIVRDLPDRLPYYDQLIQALDVEPQALEIEATIIDLNTNRLRELGINWRLTDDRYSLLFGNGSNSDNLLRTGSLVQDITPRAEGGVMSLVLGGRNNFVARISAMQNQGAARIVSSPQVMTLSNVEALLDTTETFYIPVAGRDEVDLFKVSAGTTLRVSPCL